MRYVLITLIAVTACSANTSTNDDISPAITDMVDTLRADGDCGGLQAAFDRTDDADELRYIDDALRAAGCYG